MTRFAVSGFGVSFFPQVTARDDAREGHGEGSVT